MAKKKSAKTAKQIVADEFPGWKVVEESAAVKNARTMDSKKPYVDAVTPPLDQIKSKLTGKSTKKKAASSPDARGRRTAKKKPVKHAKFVTIAPANVPDSMTHKQKVILVRDGKVVAQQG